MPFRNITSRIRRLYHTVPTATREWLGSAGKIGLVVFAAYLVVGGLLAIPVYRGTENWFTLFLERLYPYPAMSVRGTVIPLDRYRAEVAARTTYAATHNLTSSDAETRQFVIDQLVSRALFAQELERAGIVVTEGDVDQKLQEIYDQIGGKDKLAKFLQQNYGNQATLSQFRIWIRESLVEAAVKQQLLTHAKVRHILIAVPEGADQKAIDAARAKAVDIRGKIGSVEQFGDIAREYSEDIASRDKGGELGTTARGDSEPVFSAAFEDALFTLPVGQISDPVQSKYGWHLIVVDVREGNVDLSAPELLEKLRSEGRVRVFVKAEY